MTGTRQRWRTPVLVVFLVGLAGFVGPAETGALLTDGHDGTGSVEAADNYVGDCGNTAMTICSLSVADASSEPGSQGQASGPPGQPEARYEVTYDVSDPDGGSQFRNVTVSLRRGGSTVDTASSRQKSRTLVVSEPGNNIGTSYTVVVELYDTNSEVVECRETTDEADGTDPPSPSTC